MQLDADNTYGIAAQWATSADGIGVSAVLVVNADGSGQVNEKLNDGDWTPFDALPPEYALGDVIDWTPWSCFTSDGVWWTRTSYTDPWEECVEIADGGKSYKPTSFVVPQQ